ncbi:MAG: PilZN3 domain-containing protein [Spirochaetia bacterium]
MGIRTSQQIVKYYDSFKETDVTFNKGVIHATGLNAQQVYLKYIGQQLPCIIYSTSMVGAKVIANIRQDQFQKMRDANNLAALRFSFKQTDKTDPLTFFVSSKVIGFTPYSKENKSLNIISLQYTQRPPDDLIEILGKLLDANVNSKKRKEERITVTTDSLRKLGLKSKEAMIYIQGVPRKCIMRDVSFSGVKVLMIGVAKFLMEKEAFLKVETEDTRKILELKGKIVRYEPVEGRKDIAAVALNFHEDTIPMEWKLKINEFIRNTRKSRVTETEPDESEKTDQ